MASWNAGTRRMATNGPNAQQMARASGQRRAGPPTPAITPPAMTESVILTRVGYWQPRCLWGSCSARLRWQTGHPAGRGPPQSVVSPLLAFMSPKGTYGRSLGADRGLHWAARAACGAAPDAPPQGDLARHWTTIRIW